MSVSGVLPVLPQAIPVPEMLSFGNQCVKSTSGQIPLIKPLCFGADSYKLLPYFFISTSVEILGNAAGRETIQMSTKPVKENHLDGDEAHQHFMRVVYQVNNIACLFQQNDDGSISAIFVTPALAKMMEFTSQEEALKSMDGENLFRNIHDEDRPLVLDMLKNRISADGTQDLMVRWLTSKGNIIHILV